MFVARVKPMAWVALALTVSVAGTSCTSTTQQKLRPVVQFDFKIPNLRTDHQFAGQKNSFDVSYQYRSGLRGSNRDAAGHSVTTDTYPYFQNIKTTIVNYIQAYRDKNNFYEVFGTDIADHVLRSYPQLTSVTLRITVPAYAAVHDTRIALIRVRR